MKRPGTAAVVSVPGAGSAVGDVGHRPTTAAGQRPTIRLSTWDQEQFINIQRTLKFVSEGEILLSTPTRLKKPKEPDPEPGEAATPNQPDPVHEIRQRLPIVPVKNELRRSRTMGRIRNKNAQRHLMACLTEEGRPKPGALKRCSSSVTFLPRHELHDANFYRYQGESSWNNIWRVPKERLKYVASQKKNQYAIESIEAAFRKEFNQDEESMRMRKERHDQILATFRVQRLRNYAREIRHSASVRRSVCANMPRPKSNKAIHQWHVSNELSRPKVNRNHPERAIGARDMSEYRGLLNDAVFGNDYEVTNAAFAYAHDVYASVQEQKQRDLYDALSGEYQEQRIPASQRPVPIKRDRLDSIVRSTKECRQELGAFETRLEALAKSALTADE